MPPGTTPEPGMVVISVNSDGSSTTRYAPGEGPNKSPESETTPTPEAPPVRPEFPKAEFIPLSDNPESPLATTPEPAPASAPTTPEPAPASAPTTPEPAPASAPTTPEPAPASAPTTPEPAPNTNPGGQSHQ